MCLNVLSLDKIERSFIDKRAIEWSDLNESMFDVYDSGNDGAYCHSINKRETFVSQKNVAALYPCVALQKYWCNQPFHVSSRQVP